MLFSIGLDRFLIDKVSDLAEAVFIGTDSWQHFRQHFHNQPFLFILFEIKHSGFDLVIRHGFSPYVW
jgi:hypothetical protein